MVKTQAHGTKETDKTTDNATEKPIIFLSETHRNLGFGHGVPRHEPSVTEGRQEKARVGDHQHHRVCCAAARVRVSHLGLDRQCQEIGEEDQETSLLFAIERPRATLEARRWVGVATERASITQVFRLGSGSYSSWNGLNTQLGILGTRTNEMIDICSSFSVSLYELPLSGLRVRVTSSQQR